MKAFSQGMVSNVLDMKSPMNPPAYKLFGLQIVALYKYVTFYSS